LLKELTNWIRRYIIPNTLTEQILVTGASGYIASQLIPQLLDQGYRVRCLVRNPDHLKYRSWVSQVDIVCGDLTQPDTIRPALTDISQAYYLVHSMASGDNYTDRDLLAARDFSILAKEAGLNHIIYLGGLADPQEDIAKHMRSRIQSGEALFIGGVPVTEFRASVIVGPGSISFEMIRYLTEQFPLIICPQWMPNLCQPISIQNIVDYLLAALKLQKVHNQVFEIGGSEKMRYADTMLRYASIRGLKRKIFILPFNPVTILAYFMSWLTPVPASITRPLVEGLKSSSIVKDPSALEEFPGIHPRDYDSSVRESLSQLDPTLVEPLWRQDSKEKTSFKHAGFCIQQLQAGSKADIKLILNRCEDPSGKWGKFVGYQDDQNPDLGKNQTILFQRSTRKLAGTLWREIRILEQDEEIQVCHTLLFAPDGAPGFLWWYLSKPWRNVVQKRELKTLID
jgi:uncharacterized protein YbjT (DUF2867 family)